MIYYKFYLFAMYDILSVFLWYLTASEGTFCSGLRCHISYDAMDPSFESKTATQLRNQPPDVPYGTSQPYVRRLGISTQSIAFNNIQAAIELFVGIKSANVQ